MRLYSTVLGQQVEDKVKKTQVGTSYGLIQALFKLLSGVTELSHRKTTSVILATVMAEI
jgi:hypothetical protein